MKTILITIIFIVCSLLQADYIRDDSKNIVYDSSLKIVWSDDANISKNWVEAYTYCQDLDFAGSTDWHLPNFNQLFTLSNKEKYNPAIDDKFKNTKNNIYWSSTTDMQDTTKAFGVHFTDGSSERIDKGEEKYVRCFKGWN